MCEYLGLPKPTLVWMLGTLVHRGHVPQVSQRGEYRVTSKLHSLGGGFSGVPAVIETSTDIAEKLTEDLLWPISIAQRDGDVVVVRYSTIPHSPYAHARSTISKRLLLWTSAHGKAWLANMPDDTRRVPTPDDAENGRTLPRCSRTCVM